MNLCVGISIKGLSHRRKFVLIFYSRQGNGLKTVMIEHIIYTGNLPQITGNEMFLN